MSFDVYELCGDGKVWPRGLMDKASDFESEDCGFDPHHGQRFSIKMVFCVIPFPI